MLIFRGDNRPPEEIFKTGFVPFEPSATLKADWLNKALVPSNPKKKSATVTDSEIAVCASLHFASAAIFPLYRSAKITYIYLIEVPDEMITLSLSDELSTIDSRNIADNTAIDLHGLQMQQARQIVNSKIERGKFVDPATHAWPLHAWEVALKRITPEHIVSSVAIERIHLPKFLRKCSTNAKGKPRIYGFEKNFRLVAEATKNPEFTGARAAIEAADEVVARHQTSEKTFMRTPNLFTGLAGTLLPCHPIAARADKKSKTDKSCELERKEPTPELGDPTNPEHCLPAAGFHA